MTTAVVGDWVELVEFAVTSEPIGRPLGHLTLGFEEAGEGLMRLNDNLLVPPGTLGKVGWVDDGGTVHVRWQNGATLGLVVDAPVPDRYEVVMPAKPCTVCGLRCAADDPRDPESYVHDEDREFDDHTAEV